MAAGSSMLAYIGVMIGLGAIIIIAIGTLFRWSPKEFAVICIIVAVVITATIVLQMMLGDEQEATPPPKSAPTEVHTGSYRGAQ